jgi:hypothetical protein
MATFTGTSVLGLQFLGQAAPGEQFGYLTLGTYPVGFMLEKKGFFYSEMQFTTLTATRDAVFYRGLNIYRAGAVITCPELPAGAFLYHYVSWRKGGLPWVLTTF